MITCASPAVRAAASLLAVVVSLSGCTPMQAQRNRLRALTPSMPAEAPRDGTVDSNVRVAPIILFADQDCRARMRWREHLESLVARANGYLEPSLGVRLEPTIRAWERAAPVEDLDSVLAEIDQLAAGPDVPTSVPWVAGIVAALPIVTSNFDKLGVANLGRRTFLMRLIDDSVEATEFTQSFHLLPPDEVSAAVRTRSEHKAVAVFLHEWAHSVGAPHVNDPRSFLNPFYDRTACRFGEPAAWLRRQLAQRLRDHAARATAAAAAGPPTARSDAPDDDERQRPGRAQQPTETKPRPPSPTRAPAATPLETEVSAALARGDRAGAYERCTRARAQLEVQRGASESDWAALARSCRRLNAPTCASQAAELADAETRAVVQRWATRERQVAGITRAAARHGVDGAREAEYLEAFEQAERAVRAASWAAAKEAVGAALERFPGAPSLLALRCEVAIHEQQRAAARRDCGQAARADSESAPVHCAVGLLVATEGELRAAEEHWRKAIALAPDHRPSWADLGWLYRSRREEKKLQKLQQDYRARFDESLPR